LNPFPGIAIVLFALGALVLGVKRLQAGGIDPELARKLVHMGMGIVCLPFPWLFAKAWPVWILAGLAGAALAALRSVPVLRRELGGVLHDVHRTSFGEVYFPLGVAAVFTLAHGHAILFVIPVALLTFADAAGALVGKRWGRLKYRTLEGQKSVEGSVAVGMVGCICSAGPLLVTGHDPREALLIGMVMGLFGLILEAISWRGTDNAFLPLAAFAQISVYLHASLGSLLARMAVLSALTVIAMIWRRGHVVDDGARLGAALAMYFFWAIGGWTWLIAPVVLLASYARLMPIHPHEMPRHDLIAVICVSSVGFVWCVAEAFAPNPCWRWLFTLGIATHQAVIATVRYSQGRPQWIRAAWLAAGVTQALLTQGLAFWLVDQGRTITGVGLGAGAACLAGATIAFALCEQKLQMPDDLNARWWKQGVTAMIASMAALLVMNL
jgi:phytol kinase